MPLSRIVEPSSPSKRRQSTSHYSDVECSPSKKGVLSNAIERLAIDDSERGLLFGADSTNIQPSAMEIDSPKRKPLAKPKQGSAGSQPQVAKVKVPKTKNANQKKATEVWVEIEAR